MGNGIANQSPFVKKDTNENILAIGKATSSKWLPAVQTDKKKQLQSMNQTRITIGVGDVAGFSP